MNKNSNKLKERLKSMNSSKSDAVLLKNKKMKKNVNLIFLLDYSALLLFKKT